MNEKNKLKKAYETITPDEETQNRIFDLIGEKLDVDSAGFTSSENDFSENSYDTELIQDEMIQYDGLISSRPHSNNVLKIKMWKKQITVVAACFALVIGGIVLFKDVLPQFGSKSETNYSLASYSDVPPKSYADTPAKNSAESFDGEVPTGMERSGATVGSPTGFATNGAIGGYENHSGDIAQNPVEVSPTAGMLTAGSIDDIGDMKHFKEYLSQTQSYWDFPSEYFENPTPTLNSSKLDLMFMIDTTGSMGDELSYLQSELTDVIQRIRTDNGQLPIRLSVNYYRDSQDIYTVKSNPFTTNISDAVSEMKEQSADGGDDWEEAVDLALENAISEHSWDSSATKLLFIVLDAPPHSTAKAKERILNTVLSAKEQGIVILPIAASGIDTTTERLLRQLAVTTGGTYQFLTDDSGIGDSHTTPTDTNYEVLPLNDLLVEIVNKYLGNSKVVSTETPENPNQIQN
ncbi:MAG: VWA domain-containing protein [Oscillospiraceae bacterium]|jgi:hypothetical protein|nr:VWA domain-containing protein [Oscillospiraceae bacterium]